MKTRRPLVSIISFSLLPFCVFSGCSTPVYHPPVASVAIYSGYNRFEDLAKFDLLILEPFSYNSSDIAFLRRQGCRVLCRIQAADRAQIPNKMREMKKELGFDGVYFDHTWTRPELGSVLRQARRAWPEGYLLVNWQALDPGAWRNLINGVMLEKGVLFPLTEAQLSELAANATTMQQLRRKSGLDALAAFTLKGPNRKSAERMCEFARGFSLVASVHRGGNVGDSAPDVPQACGGKFRNR